MLSTDRDWGKVSHEYARNRPPPPSRFFQILKGYGIGVAGQRILDLGTGVGFLPLRFAEEGAQVVGLDISLGQIQVAKTLALEKNLQIDYRVCAAESMDFQEASFDAVTAMQCWPYFDLEKLVPRLVHVLKPGSLIMVGNFDHLPREDQVAELTEQLMCECNPLWDQADWSGEILSRPAWVLEAMQMKGMFWFDEKIPFTVEQWVGRIVASRAIGVSLAPAEVFVFKRKLKERLAMSIGENFEVKHRIYAHLFTLN